MAPAESFTSLGVATKMPQTHLNTPSPRSGFHPRQHINSFMTKVLLTAIHCWTLHRKWSHSPFLFSFFLKKKLISPCNSFVHTWMPPDAEKLIMENINKNIVDLDEYPAASIIHNRCVSMSTFDLKFWFFDLRISHDRLIHSCGSLESPQGRKSNWDGHSWFLGSHHARWTRAEEKMARSTKSCRKRLLSSQHHLRFECSSCPRKICSVGCQWDW